MIRHVLALVVTWLFVCTMAAPAIASVSAPSASEVHSARHADGTPCPDEGDDDHGPCSDGCPCHCCHHGHILALWLTGPTLASGIPDPSTVAGTRPPLALRPNGYLDRIFRPPRG